MAKKPYYITTAIAYTSGKPHIGNTYEAILADAIARFKRKEGYDVKNGDFFKIGIPFTLSAIVPAYILIWILFG